jgi:hypothetical protein
VDDRNVRALLDVIDRLKSQHRAGENPTYGQLEDLFDYATRAREDLRAAPSREPVAIAPTMPEPALQELDGQQISVPVDLGKAARVVLRSLSQLAAAQ